MAFFFAHGLSFDECKSPQTNEWICCWVLGTGVVSLGECGEFATAGLVHHASSSPPTPNHNKGIYKRVLVAVIEIGSKAFFGKLMIS
jgi:hypothetical protein